MTLTEEEKLCYKAILQADDVIIAEALKLKTRFINAGKQTMLLLPRHSNSKPDLSMQVN